MSSERHLIFGTGPVGKAIMAELAQRGKNITMVNRSGRLENAPEGVSVIAADVTDEARTQQLAKGATYIYNATNPPYTEWHRLFPPLNTSILKAASAAGARLIVMDNLYMYGPTNGAPMTEQLPYRATGKKGVTRARMAEELLTAHQRGDVQMLMGRASDFFGPGVFDSSVGQRLFANAVQGKPAQMLGKIDLPRTYSYVPDVGKALVVLAHDDAAYGKAWHLPNPETVTTREFVRMVYESAGQPLKIQVIGPVMQRILAPFIPILKEVAEMNYSNEQPYVVDDSPYKKRYGDTATPLQEAIAHTVAWFQQHASRLH